MKINKSYSAIEELPSEVQSTLDETDCEKWMSTYNDIVGSNTDSNNIQEAKEKAWLSVVDAPSSLAIETWASVEIRDSDGELVPIDTIEENMDRFIKNGGLIHDEHTNVPIGSAWKWERRFNEEYNQDGIVIWFNVNREGAVAERARDDIITGRKQSVSIGAEAPRGDYVCDDKGCYVERNVTDLYEISICETPANMGAEFINVGSNISKSKKSKKKKGEVFKLKLSKMNIHKDYTMCDLQKCKMRLKKALPKGAKVHIKDNIVKVAFDDLNTVVDTLDLLGYEYCECEDCIEVYTDSAIEYFVKECLQRNWASEDENGHIVITEEIPENIFKYAYENGLIHKVGDIYCIREDDIVKETGSIGVGSSGTSNTLFTKKNRKMKKNVYADENGNRWSEDWLYNNGLTFEEAKDSLKNCHNCVNCQFCENCENCQKCNYCTNCNNLNHCVNCHNCTNCMDCVLCYDCENCSSGYENKKCVSCNDCRYCTNCNYCIDVDDYDWNYPRFYE